MLKNRIIPVILLREGVIIQSFNFKDYSRIGNPINIIRRLSKWMSDEIIYLNISKHDKKFSLGRSDLNVESSEFEKFEEIIELVSKHSLCPITFGGSINSIEKINLYLSKGADKISINSKAIEDPNFISEAANKFGSQCITVSVDYLKENGKNIVVYKGIKKTDLDLFEWCKKCEDLGCGEILVNCINNDGKKNGYDIETLKILEKKLDIPIIALGGAGSEKHFEELFNKTGVKAAAAANLFHHLEQADFKIKKYLFDRKYNIRKPEFFDINIIKNNK